MSTWSAINEFFRKNTIYKVRKFFHMKEIHWNNGERCGQKNNMKKLLQMASVVRERWWKARGNEASVCVPGGFDKKAPNLKLDKRQRYTEGFKLQKQLLLLTAMGDNAGQTGKKQWLCLGGQQGKAPWMSCCSVCEWAGA